jgi:hypothetical protein
VRRRGGHRGVSQLGPSSPPSVARTRSRASQGRHKTLLLHPYKRIRASNAPAARRRMARPCAVSRCPLDASVWSGCRNFFSARPLLFLRAPSGPAASSPETLGPGGDAVPRCQCPHRPVPPPIRRGGTGVLPVSRPPVTGTVWPGWPAAAPLTPKGVDSERPARGSESRPSGRSPAPAAHRLDACATAQLQGACGEAHGRAPGKSPGTLLACTPPSRPSTGRFMNEVSWVAPGLESR